MLTSFLDGVKSFAIARSLMTAIELDVFRVLERGPLSRADLKKRLSISDTPIADAFFDVLVSFEILAEEKGKLRLLSLGRSVLPVYESIQSWNKEMDLFYTSLNDLTGLLKSGRYRASVLSDYWRYKKSSKPTELQGSDVHDYSSVMDASQLQLSRLIVEFHEFGAHEHIIDFGGGYGRLAISLAEKYPHLRLTIADLPAVCEGARQRISAPGLAERIEYLPVDFLRGDLPKGVADGIIFSRVLHDWSDDEVFRLLLRSRTCLREHGKIYVLEPMLDENEDSDMSSVLSSLMVTLFGGKRRSVQEYTKFLRSAGYVEVSWKDCGLSIYKMIVGHI